MFSLLKKYELRGAKRRVRLFNRFQIESVLKIALVNEDYLLGAFRWSSILTKASRYLDVAFHDVKLFNMSLNGITLVLISQYITDILCAKQRFSFFIGQGTNLTEFRGFNTTLPPYVAFYNVWGRKTTSFYWRFLPQFLSSSVPQFCSRGYTRYLQIVSNYILLYI